MLQSAATDGRKKERLITIVSGALHTSGTIRAKILNDRGIVYHVTLPVQGIPTCYREENGHLVKCEAFQHKQRCYHVNAVENVGLCFHDEGFEGDDEYEPFDVIAQAARVAGDADLDYVYSDLAPTKVLVRDEPVGSRLERIGWVRGGRAGGVLSGNVNA